MRCSPTSIAQQTDLEVGDFVHALGDAHLYLNHLAAGPRAAHPRTHAAAHPAAARRASRSMPTSWTTSRWSDYVAHPSIKAPIAV
ncbi:MAG: thymidylate synthase [Tetrasphaera sp.]